MHKRPQKFFLLMTLAFPACSSTVLVEEKATLPAVPAYAKIPHPRGYDLADLQALFRSPGAPADALEAFSQNCDADFQPLKKAVEMVEAKPETMHWCFYAKITKLQEYLQGDASYTDRQKAVLNNFEFLSPLANAFLNVYHDSRYLRWATQYYSKISEWVFFRKLVPTAENTLLLTNSAHLRSEEEDTNTEPLVIRQPASTEAKKLRISAPPLGEFDSVSKPLNSP